MATSLDDGDNDSIITIHHTDMDNGSQPSDDNEDTKPQISKKMVTFASLPLPPGKTATETNTNIANTAVTSPKAHPNYNGKGFRRDYSLGKTARCPSHMINAECATAPEQALRSIDKLKALDFAFVKRSPSDEMYSYAILACRSLEPPCVNANRSPSGTTLEERMVFVMCDAGSTVNLRKNEWVENVKLVSMEGLAPGRKGSSSIKTKHANQDIKPLSNGGLGGGEWAPYNIISFFPGSDDSISSISSSFHIE